MASDFAFRLLLLRLMWIAFEIASYFLLGLPSYCFFYLAIRVFDISILSVDLVTIQLFDLAIVSFDLVTMWWLLFSFFQCHEVVALQILMLLVSQPTDDSVEVAVGFLKECGNKLKELSPKSLNGNQMIDWFVDWLIHSFIDRFIDWFIDCWLIERRRRWSKVFNLTQSSSLEVWISLKC